MHFRRLSFDQDLIRTPMKTRTRISRHLPGESIPSVDSDTLSQAAELQALLDSQPKLDGSALPAFSVEEADFDAGRVVLRFAAQPAFKNYHGNVQGGFAVAMVDVLVSVAAYAKTGAWLPTVEIKSTFVAPMMLGESRGEASVIKAGKHLVFLEAKLWGADGMLAVHATATAFVLRREAKAEETSAAA